MGTARGSDDLVNTGPLAPNQTSYHVPTLPGGRPLYARIYSAVDGHWSHADISFRAPTAQPAFTWPTHGQTNVGTDRPFTWSTVAWATNYWVTIGTSEGGAELLSTGTLPAGQSSYANLPPLPAGVPLYARLLTHDGANWTHIDVIFTAAPSPA